MEVVDRPVSGLQTPSDSAHLRSLIEKQPVCLVRVSLDGILLAVNEAALSLFGAGHLGQVLETSFVERFLRDQELWRDFSSRVWASGSGSADCELTDVSGDTRSVRLQGVARLDHPDGIDALFMTIRDISSTVRLENAIEETAQARASLDDTDRQLEATRIEQERLASALSQAEAEQRRLSELLAEAAANERRIEARAGEERARAIQLLEEQHRADLAAHAQKAQDLFDDLQEQLALALAGQRRLAAAEHERAGRLQVTEQELAERQQIEADHARHRAELEARLQQQDRALAAAAEEKRELAAQEHAARDQIAALAAAVNGHTASEAERQHRIERLQAELAATADERAAAEGQRDRERAAIAEELHGEWQRALQNAEAESHQALERRDREYREAVERLEASARAERGQLTDRLQQDYEITLATERGEARKRIDAAEVELAATCEEIVRLTGQAERDRAQLAALQREYAQTVDTMRGDHQRQVEALRREEEELREALRQEHQHTLALNEQEIPRQAEQLHDQIEQARTQQLWLQEEFARETARMRQELADGVSVRMADHAHAERLLTDAVARKHQALKAFADQGAEVRALQETVRTLSAAAAEGRLARAVAPELHRVLIALDDRARYLLTLTSLDDVHRDEVEGVRKEILAAAALAQQLGQPPAQTGPVL
ncbi:MAG TPA: PAS domain-containing protein [Vicinamibacterales bacterium]|nr:PAS domain-containing protein [Vicinamibacterales bacterium]